MKMVIINETSYVQLNIYLHIYEAEENIKNRFRSKATGRNPGFSLPYFQKICNWQCLCMLSDHLC